MYSFSLRTQIGGGDQGFMTDGWPASWPRAGAAHIFPCAPNEHFTHRSQNQSHAKDAALRERCGAETRWMACVADPPRGLSTRCEGSGGRGAQICLHPPQTSLARKTPCLLRLLPAHLEALPLHSAPLALSVGWGWFQIHLGAPRLRTNTSQAIIFRHFHL